MIPSRSELCAFCLVSHAVVLPCASLCEHCKALHMLMDLVEGQCPKLKGFAQEEQYNQMMPCGECSLGKRLADLEAGKEVGFSEEKQEKQEEKQISQGSGCQECLGFGLLPLLVFCCTDGCHKCGFLKFKPHPGVKRLHMRPIITEKERKQCAICLQVIKQGDSIFRMQCDHEFHFLCMGQWLLTSKRCPCCRHTDLFLEVDVQFLELLRQMQGYPKSEFIPAYINEYGEVVEGIQSDSDRFYSQPDEEEYYEHIEIYDDDEAEVEVQSIVPFRVIIQNLQEEEEGVGNEATILFSGNGINFSASNNFLSGRSGYSSVSSEACCFEPGDDEYDGLWGAQ